MKTLMNTLLTLSVLSLILSMVSLLLPPSIIGTGVIIIYFFVAGLVFVLLALIAFIWTDDKDFK